MGEQEPNTDPQVDPQVEPPADPPTNQNDPPADPPKTFSQEVVYDYNDDNMPQWSRKAVHAAMDCGAVQDDENGRLGLSYKDLRAICREYRCGLYNR